MNKTFFKIILIFLTLTPSISYSQYNVLTIDGIKILSSIRGFPSIRMAYERSLNKSFSAVISGEAGTYLTGSTTGGGANETYSLSGYGVMGELRYYPFTKNKPAPIGFFIGGHLRYRAMHENYTGPDYTGTNSSNPPSSQAPQITVENKGSLTDYGLSIGYKIKSKNGSFVFEPLIGYGIGIVNGFSSAERVRIDPFYIEPINEFINVFRLQLSVGFVFPNVKYFKKMPPEDNGISY